MLANELRGKERCIARLVLVRGAREREELLDAFEDIGHLRPSISHHTLTKRRRVLTVVTLPFPHDGEIRGSGRGTRRARPSRMENLHKAADTAARLSEHGPSALSNEELLALLLRDAATGEGATHLARRVLSDRSLSQLAREPARALARRSGLSPLYALRLATAMELFRRVEREDAALPSRISDTLAVYTWAKPRLVPLQHEELWMLALDGRNNVRGSRRVSMGGRHGLSVSAPDVLRLALLEGAAGFVLVHNHPSGNPEPSAEDQRFTERVAEAAAAVDVPLFDHVVVASGGYSRVSLG